MTSPLEPSKLPFTPCAIAEMNLIPGRGVDDLSNLDGYRRVLILIRLEGAPIGYVELPVVDGRCKGADIAREASARHEERIVKRWIAAALDPVPLAVADGALPSITAAVCTRNRSDDLACCLASLVALDYPNLEVLVVDNAPPDDRTEQVVRRYGARARYVREDRAGLSWARRRAVTEARGDIVAFVDDDERADRKWAAALGRAFSAGDDVAAVLGLVAPMELETDAEEWFELHGGFGRGFERRWLRRRVHERAAPTLANTGTFGTGANMAFKRSVFDEVGGFAPALGAGSPSDGGEDLDMIFRVLKAGHTLVYEPEALAWHRHRRTREELRHQAVSWGRGMMAYLALNSRRYPDERPGLTRLAAGLLLAYYPRRIVQSLFDRRLHFSLVVSEYLGALTAPSHYRKAQRMTADAIPHEPALSRVETPSVWSAAIDVGDRLPDRIPNVDRRDLLELTVNRGTQKLDVLRIVTGGCSVSRARVVDELVARIGTDLLDPAGRFRTRARTEWAAAAP